MGVDDRLPMLPAILVTALAAYGCAGEGGAAQPGPAADTFVAADGQTVRCVNEAVTGSRVPQRVCRTGAEWQQIEEASKAYARDAQGPLTAPPET